MILFDQVDKQWSLFLDRDGVLNHEKNQDYIRHHDEFIFYPDVPEVLGKLSTYFNRIIIVTNQRGIGKGLMTHDDLTLIHQKMLQAIEIHGGKIDKIYYAPDMDSNSPNRKPNTGMGIQAKQDFPDIDFNKSIMVGNNLSDMQFGKNLGMKTVFVETTSTLPNPHEWVDLKLSCFIDLLQQFNQPNEF